MFKTATCLKVFILTTDGDNLPIDTEVFATEAGARAALITALASWEVTQTADGAPLGTLSTDDLCALWEATADGTCILAECEVQP
jgi:hypothetical protein